MIVGRCSLRAPADSEELILVVAERNLGVLTLDEPIKAVPEFYELPIDVGAEEPLVLKAYPKGPATPLSVLLAEAAAYAEWNDAMPAEEDRATLTPRRWMARRDAAEWAWRVNLLQAAIPDLTEAHAQSMIADGGPWERLLLRLRYVEPAVKPADGQEEPADPEAPGEPAASVGETDSPDSAPTTPDTIPEA